MPPRTRKPDESVADALARWLEARRGEVSAWPEALRALGAVDRAVYKAVAATPTAELDVPVRRLAQAANHSRLWLSIATAIALAGGRRGRLVALEGVICRKRPCRASPTSRSLSTRVRPG